MSTPYPRRVSQAIKKRSRKPMVSEPEDRGVQPRRSTRSTRRPRLSLPRRQEAQPTLPVQARRKDAEGDVVYSNMDFSAKLAQVCPGNASGAFGVVEATWDSNPFAGGAAKRRKSR